MDGMKVLVQANMPISRPDDFLAEMLKTDKHMVNVKSRFLQQQVKIKTFEEKKQKAENKKFHKAIKDFKMKQKHQDKKDTSNAI
jgi:rRNA-processing protein EBP2